MFHWTACAALAEHSPMTLFAFERRETKQRDITLQIAHCGICHSDVSYIDDSVGGARFPLAPGDEIVGRVSAIGPALTKFMVGDPAAIGCFTDSCRVCGPCRTDKQHTCIEGLTGAFGGLGHIAVKLAIAMGAEVAVVTCSDGKLGDAKALGAADAAVARDSAQMKRQASRFAFILDTVSSPHDIQAYINYFKPEATL